MMIYVNPSVGSRSTIGKIFKNLPTVVKLPMLKLQIFENFGLNVSTLSSQEWLKLIAWMQLNAILSYSQNEACGVRKLGQIQELRGAVTLLTD